MIFEDALRLIRRGRELRRKAWPPGHHLKQMPSNMAMKPAIFRSRGDKPTELARITSQDLLATDWEQIGN